MAFRNNLTPDLSGGWVAAQMAASFVTFASSQGAECEELLRASGIKQAELADGEGRVPLRRFAELVWEAKRQTGEAGLPLFFAAHADFSEVSIAGLIANASPTMSQAMEGLNQYSGLTISVPMEGDIPFRLEQGKPNDRIVNCRRPRFHFPELTELTFTYLITGPRRFLPSPHVVGVELTHPKPKHHEVYSEVWQCEVTFDAPASALIIPSWVANHPVRLQPPYALSILKEHADQLLANLEGKGEFSRRLEALIMRSLHTGRVSADWAAREIGMSRQSLYRRLAEEGTSFEDVLNRVRSAVAIDHLQNGTATVGEIALLTGYSEASAFSRAFKRWTGKMPGEWRRKIKR